MIKTFHHQLHQRRYPWTRRRPAPAQEQLSSVTIQHQTQKPALNHAIPKQIAPGPPFSMATVCFIAVTASTFLVIPLPWQLTDPPITSHHQRMRASAPTQRPQEGLLAPLALVSIATISPARTLLAAILTPFLSCHSPQQDVQVLFQLCRILMYIQIRLPPPKLSQRHASQITSVTATGMTGGMISTLAAALETSQNSLDNQI